MHLAVRCPELPLNVRIESFKPYIIGQYVGVGKFFEVLDEFQGVSGVVEIIDEFVFRRFSSDVPGQLCFCFVYVDRGKGIKRALLCPVVESVCIVVSECGPVNPFRRPAKRQPAEFADKKVSERVIYAGKEYQTIFFCLFVEFFFGKGRHLPEDVDNSLHLRHPASFIGIDDHQVSVCPGDLRPGRNIMVPDQFSVELKDQKDARKQESVALFEGSFLAA